MTKITEAAFSDEQLRRARQPRPSVPSPFRAPVVPASAPPVLSLVLIVGGVGAVLAPDPLPFPGDVLALGAAVLGGWLLGRGAGGGDPTSGLAERTLRATFAERGEVIRAALALASISGSDERADRARRAGAVAAAVEPDQPGEDDGSAGRPDLRSIPGRVAGGASESLDFDRDGDV